MLCSHADYGQLRTSLGVLKTVPLLVCYIFKSFNVVVDVNTVPLAYVSNVSE